MSLNILGVGAANPVHVMSQQDAQEMAADMCAEDDHHRRLLRALYRRSGVHSRQTVLPHRTAYEWRSADGNGDLSWGPTTGERMQYFEALGPPLAIEAASQALSDAHLDPRTLTHLVTVSCTGFSAPGVDVSLIQELGLPATTQRINVGFMGCHGAINGLRAAQALVDADPQAKVLLCAVECCSLHYRFQWDPDRMVGNALFSDGAAAVVCGSSRASLNGNDPRRTPLLAATGSCLIPDSRDAIKWEIRDNGFEMYLSPEVPDLIEKNLRPWLSEWLAGHGLTIEQVRGWAVHPGGPRILQAVEKCLDLPEDALQESRAVLREHGNMSSPTVLFILDRIRQRPDAWPCVSLGFGPGLAAEVALYLPR